MSARRGEPVTRSIQSEAPRGDGAPRATKAIVATGVPSPVARPTRLPGATQREKFPASAQRHERKPSAAGGRSPPRYESHRSDGGSIPRRQAHAAGARRFVGGKPLRSSSARAGGWNVLERKATRPARATSGLAPWPVAARPHERSECLGGGTRRGGGEGSPPSSGRGAGTAPRETPVSPSRPSGGRRRCRPPAARRARSRGSSRGPPCRAPRRASPRRPRGRARRGPGAT